MEIAAPVGRGPFTAGDILGRTPEDNVRREVIDGWMYLDGGLWKQGWQYMTRYHGH